MPKHHKSTDRIEIFRAVRSAEDESQHWCRLRDLAELQARSIVAPGKQPLVVIALAPAKNLRRVDKLGGWYEVGGDVDVCGLFPVAGRLDDEEARALDALRDAQIADEVYETIRTSLILEAVERQSVGA